MTTPTPQPSENPSAEAMAAAKEVCNDFDLHQEDSYDDIIVAARVIDTHLAPLRERAERAEKAMHTYRTGYTTAKTAFLEMANMVGDLMSQASMGDDDEEKIDAFRESIELLEAATP